MKDTIRNQRLFFISLVGIVVVSLIMGTTFAYQTIQIEKTEGSSTDVTVEVGKLDVTFNLKCKDGETCDEENNNYDRLNLTNMPLLKNYKTAEYVEMTIDNTASTDDIAYQISLTSLNYSNSLVSEDFKYTVTEVIDSKEKHIITGDFSTLSGTEFTLNLKNETYNYINKGEIQKIRLYLWLQETSEDQNHLRTDEEVCATTERRGKGCVTFVGKIELKSYFQYETKTSINSEGTLAFKYGESSKLNFKTNTIVEDNEIKTKAVSLPFSVKNISEEHQKITIKISNIEMDDALKNIDFRWGLYNADTDKGLSFGIFKYTSNEEIIYRDTIIDAGSNAKNYILRIWVHNNGTAQTELLQKSFKGEVQVIGEPIEYTDESCFTFVDNLDITAYDDATCGLDIVIPKTINGYEVKGIGNSRMLSVARSIIFPDTLDYIVETDYNLTTGLTNITFPENINTINIRNYSTVTGSMSIPETVTSYTYDSAPAELLVLPGTISAPTIEMSKATDIILMNGITNVTNIWSPTLKTIEIPATVTTFNMINGYPYHILEQIVIRGKDSFSDFASERMSNYTEINYVFRD